MLKSLLYIRENDSTESMQTFFVHGVCNVKSSMEVTYPGAIGRSLGSGAASLTVFGLCGMFPLTISERVMDSLFFSLTQGTKPAVDFAGFLEP